MIKVLVAGYGSIGKRHVDNFLEFKDIQLIVYTKRNDLQLLKKKGVKVSNSLAECLKENPNIGIITNETSLHIPIAIKLAKKRVRSIFRKTTIKFFKRCWEIMCYCKEEKTDNTDGM